MYLLVERRSNLGEKVNGYQKCTIKSEVSDTAVVWSHCEVNLFLFKSLEATMTSSESGFDDAMEVDP